MAGNRKAEHAATASTRQQKLTTSSQTELLYDFKYDYLVTVSCVQDGK